MVRLVKLQNLKQIANAITAFFKFQQHFTHILPVNHPYVDNCLYAMWHNQQCCVYGLPNKKNTNVLVSRSKDGDVVASAIERAFGFKTIRGSKGKQGAVEATMQMIDALKNGDSGAIMVDGPKGPLHEVKPGAIKIAKHAGVPIVPVVWYSNNFNLFKLPSWDKLEMPVLDVRLINLYGEPIYIPADCDETEDEKYRLRLQDELLKLLKQAPEEYKRAYWFGLFKK